MVPAFEAQEPVLAVDVVKRVRAVLFLNGVRGADIDDATQDVQLRFVQRHASITDPGPWACAVASRLAIDMHRRSRTRRLLSERLTSARALVHEDPDVALADAVERALQALEPDLRAAVVLRFFADLTIPEIAQLMSTPEGTIKSRLHRATAVLRDALKEED